jgi:RNA polymerase sigma-70 factor (ECF subfamily)
VTELIGARPSASARTDRAAARVDDLDRRYRKAIVAYCNRRLRSREEAEDAAQTVFLNAYNSLANGTEPQSEQAWLFTIAEHVVTYRHRVMTRRARFEGPADVDELASARAAASFDDASDVTVVMEALSELPLLEQRAFLLREWCGLTYHEMADELGVTESAVETLLARARRNLVARLQGLRPGGRRILGAFVPWPSLGWLIRSGAAVKGLAGAASVAVVAGALPFAVPFIAKELRPPAPARALVARSTHHRAHVAQRVATRLAPTPVAVRAAHKRHHTAKAVRPAPVVAYAGPAAQIPADELATTIAADTAQPSAGGTASAVDLPPADSSTASTPPDSQRQLDTSSPPHGHDPQGEGGGQSSAGGPGNSANSPN